MPFVTSNGVKIHFEIEGQGPPLVLQHGYSNTMDNWRLNGYTKELGKSHTLILLDARGHGGSDKPHDDVSYNYRLFIEDIVAILDSLNFHRAHYFGYSMGGKIGFHIPLYAPDRFYSLVLGGSAYPKPGVEATENKTLVFLREAITQAIQKNPEKPMEAYVADLEKKWGPMLPEAKAQSLANDALAMLAVNHALGETPGPAPEEVLPKVKLPVLIYAGEADPILSASKTCAGRIPNSNFFSLPGLDHSQTFQHSELILPRVKKFLTEVGR
jgi:pimeloyl-ACP methyl ester carboxylesterase